MSSTITPSDSYVAALNPPPPKPVPERLRDILPGYTITHVLGAGGFATVYKAVDTDGNEVALKVPRVEMPIRNIMERHR